MKQLVSTGNFMMPDGRGAESDLIAEGGINFLLLNYTYLQRCK